MQFVVSRSEKDTSSVPATLREIAPYPASAAVGTRHIVLGFGDLVWTMNGLVYDPARIDETSKVGQVYIWSIQNLSPMMHPFHKHLTEFNVLDIDGQPPPAYAAGWKDTVEVPAGSTVRIIFKDERFTGTYVLHCHRLEHEDHRMMLQERVVP